MVDKTNCLKVCRSHGYRFGDVVVPEPYVPYFPKEPDEWNGTLVVAIAQNLSDTSRAYRTWLENLDSHSRQDRLNRDDIPGGGIGIGPWDDGTIKVAIASIRGDQAVKQVAVSNAIMWSGKQSGANEVLSVQASIASVGFWREMLSVLQPVEIITFGARARDIMRRAGAGSILIDMPGPFTRNYSLGFKMDTGRLRKAFPEVANAIASLSGSIEIRNEGLALHCACACVSRIINTDS